MVGVVVLVCSPLTRMGTLVRLDVGQMRSTVLSGEVAACPVDRRVEDRSSSVIQVLSVSVVKVVGKLVSAVAAGSMLVVVVV